MYYINKVVFSLLFINFVGCNVNYGKLPITLYYEGLCSDTKRFVLYQLVPTMRRLQDYVTVDYIPFGKAHSVQNGQRFVCQHGPSECRSNRIMDCALNTLRSAREFDRLEYVACEMRTEAAAGGSYECINNSSKVQNCATGSQGTTLQLHSEYLTKLVNPAFIPTITVNRIFDQNTQDWAIIDLFGMLCSKLGSVPPCAAYAVRQSNAMEDFVKL